MTNLQVNRTEFATYKFTQGKSSMSDGDFIKWMIDSGKIYSALERSSEGYQSHQLKDVQVYVPLIEVLQSSKIINDINELIPTYPIGGADNLDTCVASGSYPYNYITSANTTSPFYVENEEDRTTENDGRYDLFVISSQPDTGGFRTVYQVLKGRDEVKENMWTRLFFNKDGEISSANWIKCGQ